MKPVRHLKFRIAWICAHPSGISYAPNYSVGPVSRVLKREGQGERAGEKGKEKRQGNGKGKGRGKGRGEVSRPVKPVRHNSNIHHKNPSGKYLNLSALETPLGWAHGLGERCRPFFEI